MSLRVLSYNVHKFFNVSRTHYFLKTLKSYLQDLDLDIIMIQEMRGEHSLKHRQEFLLAPLEHLADEIWDYFAYGKNAVYTSGHHGNAILSRHPFLDWKNYDISTNRYERRSVLVGKVRYQNIDLRVACTHLDLTKRGRARQQDHIIDILKLHNLGDWPLLIGGDFNDWRGFTRAKFRSLGLKDIFQEIDSDTAFTYPSRLPVFALDKIFYHRLKLVKCGILDDPHWRKLSDHLPIFAEFEIPPLPNQR